MEDQAEPVKVFIRIRPELGNVGTGNGNNKCLVVIDEKSLRLSPPDGSKGARKSVSAVDDKLYSFDQVFPESSSQEDVYNHVASMVRATIRGYNTTVFAYGSTGSGKSFSMTGTSSHPGVIPRVISEVFSVIETTATADKDVFFYVRLSYVELYNNQFRNLLDSAPKDQLASNKVSGDTSILKDESSFDLDTSAEHSRLGMSDRIEVRESPTAGIFLAGPNLRLPVTSAQEAFQLIALGNKARAVGSTNCNDQSSRSHAILTLHVESRVAIAAEQFAATDSTGPAVSGGGELRLGKMHLVDLAGSERLAMSGAEGETLVETQNINLSLTAIGDVLSALSKNAAILAQQQSQNGSRYAGQAASNMASIGTNVKPVAALVPVPYRNSKLTHLLKDSLGGNSKTIMITTVRTPAEYYQQTAISLMYASRAKKVRNRCLVNRNIIGDTGIHAVTLEIERLKSRLDDRNAECERLLLLHMDDAEQNAALKARYHDLQVANEREKKQLEQQMRKVIHSQEGQLRSQQVRISELQNSLQGELALSQNKIAEQENDIKWLKRALDDATVAAQQPSEELARVKQMLTAWQVQVKTTQSELGQSMTQIDDLTQQKNALENELLRIRGLYDQAREEITFKSTEVRGLAEKLALTETELSLKQQAYDKVHTSVVAMKEENAGIDNNLKLSQQEIVRLQEVIKLSEAARENIAASLSNTEKEKTELARKLESTISSLESWTTAAIRDMQLKLQEKDSLVLSLRQQRDEAYLSAESSTKRLELMVSTAASEQIQFNGLSNRIRELEIENASMSKELASRDQSIAGLQEQNRLLSGESEGLKAELQALDQQIEVEKQDLKIERKAVVQLEGQLRLTSEDLDLEKNKFKKLKQVYQELLEQRTAKENYEQQREELLRKQASEMQELRAAFSKREESLIAQLTLSEDKLREGLILDRDIAASVSKLKEQHASDLVSLEDRLNSESETKIKELVDQTSQRIREIETDCEDKLKALELSSEGIIRKHQQENMKMAETIRILEENEQLRMQEIMALRNELSLLPATIRESARIEFESNYQKLLIEQIERERSILTEKHTLELESLRNDLQQNNQRLVEDAVNATKSKYQAQLKSAVALHKVKLEEHFAAREKLLAEKEEAISARKLLLEEEVRELSVRLENSQSQSASIARQTLEACKEALVCEYEAKITENSEKLAKEFESRLVNELERQAEKLNQVHEEILHQSLRNSEEMCYSALQEMRLEHDIRLKEISSAHAANVTKIESRMSELVKATEDNYKKLLIDEAAKVKLETTKLCEAEYAIKFHEEKLRIETEINRTKDQYVQTAAIELAELRSRYQQTLVRDLQVARDDWQNYWNTEKATLLADAESRLMKEQLNIEQLEGQLDAREKTISSLLDQLQNLRVEFEAEMSCALISKEEALQSVAESKMTGLRESLTSEFALEMARVQAAHAQILEEQKASMVKKQALEIAQLTESFSEWKAQQAAEATKRLLSRREQDEIALRGQRDEFKQMLDKLLAERDAEHERVLDGIRLAHENELEGLATIRNADKIAHAAELQACLDRHANDFRLAENSWTQKLAIEAKHNEQRLQDALAMQKIELDGHHQKELSEIKIAYQSSLETKMEEISVDMDVSKKANSELHMNLLRQQAGLEHEKRQIIAGHRKEIEQVQEHMRQKNDAAVAVVQERYEVILNAYRTEYTSKLAEFERTRDQMLSTLAEQHDQHVADIELRHLRSLELAENRLAAAHAELTRELEAKFQRIILEKESEASILSARNSELTELLDSVKETHSNIASDIQSKFASERNSLILEYMKKIDDLADEHANEIGQLKQQVADSINQVNEIHMKFNEERSGYILQIENFKRLSSDAEISHENLKARLNDTIAHLKLELEESKKMIQSLENKCEEQTTKEIESTRLIETMNRQQSCNADDQSFRESELLRTLEERLRSKFESGKREMLALHSAELQQQELEFDRKLAEHQATSREDAETMESHLRATLEVEFESRLESLQAEMEAERNEAIGVVRSVASEKAIQQIASAEEKWRAIEKDYHVEITKLKSEIVSLSDELSHLHPRNIELDRLLEEKTQECQVLGAKELGWNNELQLLIADQSSYLLKIGQLEQMITDSERRLEEVSGTMASERQVHLVEMQSLQSKLAQKLVDDSVSIIDQWKQASNYDDMVQKCSEFDALASELSVLRTKYDAEKAVWIASVTRLEQSVDDLNQQLSRLQGLVEESKLAEIQTNNHRLISENELFEVKLLNDHLSMQIDELRSRAEGALQNSSSLENELRSLSESFSQKSSHCKEIESELLIMKNRIAEQERSQANAVDLCSQERNKYWEAQIEAERKQIAQQVELLRSEYKHSLAISIEEHENLLRKKVESESKDKIESILELLRSQNSMEQTTKHFLEETLKQLASSVPMTRSIATVADGSSAEVQSSTTRSSLQTTRPESTTTRSNTGRRLESKSKPPAQDSYVIAETVDSPGTRRAIQAKERKHRQYLGQVVNGTIASVESDERDRQAQLSGQHLKTHVGMDSGGDDVLVAQFPWTSPTTRSEPVDQLTAAILDGNTDSVRKVIKSRGHDLRSQFWNELCRNTLPLHRAISGFHFHGSESLLVNTLTTLLDLGADINAIDLAGNSVLHKVLSVCQSRQVIPILSLLLNRGANVGIQCHEGYSALHLECWRMRSTSSEVIDLLLRHGANANELMGMKIAPDAKPLDEGRRNNKFAQVREEQTLTVDADCGTTPMSLVLQRWTSREQLSTHILPLRLLQSLISAGGQWNPLWMSRNQSNQLHYLLSWIPECEEEVRFLSDFVRSALPSMAVCLFKTNAAGLTPLKVFCITLSGIKTSDVPSFKDTVEQVIQSVGSATALLTTSGTSLASIRACVQEAQLVSDSAPQSYLSLAKIMLGNLNLLTHRSPSRASKPMQPTSITNSAIMDVPETSGGLAVKDSTISRIPENVFSLKSSGLGASIPSNLPTSHDSKPMTFPRQGMMNGLPVQATGGSTVRNGKIVSVRGEPTFAPLNQIDENQPNLRSNDSGIDGKLTGKEIPQRASLSLNSGGIGDIGSRSVGLGLDAKTGLGGLKGRYAPLNSQR